MSNEIRTRRLIVTLPEMAAEEIAERAEYLSEFLRYRHWANLSTVEIARDDYQPIADALQVFPHDIIDSAPDRVSLTRADAVGLLMLLTKDEAQQLGAQLLRAADQIQEN